MWSGIKSILVLKDGVSTKSWKKVDAWLKRHHEATKNKSTSAPIFTMEQINKFREEADPNVYERHLLAVTMGIQGRFRSQDYGVVAHDLDHRQYIRLKKSYVFSVCHVVSACHAVFTCLVLKFLLKIVHVGWDCVHCQTLFGSNYLDCVLVFFCSK